MLLFAAAQFLSVLGMPLALFAPAPLAILAVRRGWPVFLGAAALGLVALGLLTRGPGAVSFLFAVGVPAFLIAQGLTRQWPPEVTVGASAGILTVATLAALQMVLPDGIRPWVAGLVTQSIDTYAAQPGAQETMVQMLRAEAEPLTDAFFHMLPMAVAWTGITLSAVSLLLSRAFFARRPHPAVRPFAPLTWHLPDPWIWALIAAAVLLLLPHPVAKIAGGNALGVLALAYAFQGWAVLAYIFKAKSVHRAVQAAFYLLMLLWPVLAVFLVLVGVFDLWTDLRKVRPPADAAAG